MSTFEIILLIGACASPILALLFVISKKKKENKEKSPKTNEITKEVDKKLESKQIKDEQTKEKEQFKLNNQDFSKSELMNYAKTKSKSFTSPVRKHLPPEFEDLSREYAPRREKIKKQEDKSISEQIQDLSPELKALLVAGVLDKKDY